MRSVYLDHQASTRVHPAVWGAMTPFFRDHYGSAASFHRGGLEARDAMAQARVQVARLLNAGTPEEILFTSGGTESANLAVKGTAYANQRRGRHLVISAIEHPAVTQSAEALRAQGFEVTKVKVDSHGLVDPAAVEEALTDQTILICVHHVNHDIGTLEPIQQISRLANERGITCFVDAVASGGWLPIDVQTLGVGLLSLSPHRFYGPKGVGILYRNRRARLESMLHGGNQEDGKRAGTENIPGIVGAGAACELAAAAMDNRMSLTRRLQKKLWSAIQSRVPYVRLNGPPPGPQRIPTNLNLSVEFVEGEGLVLLLDMQGIAAASGPSCASKAAKIPPVLTEIGLAPALAQGNLLLSLGEENTESEIDYVSDILPGAVERLRGMSPMWDAFQRGELDSLTEPGTRPERGSDLVQRAAPAGPEA